MKRNIGWFEPVVATGQVGGPGTFWEGHKFELFRGPHWLVRIRAEWYLIGYPYRRVYIKRAEAK